jgi:sulfite reductase (ferredoxin)
VYLGGSIDAENTTFAEHIGIVPARVLPQVVVQFVSALQERQDSNLSQYIVNEGKLSMQELIAKFSYVPPYEENNLYYTDFGKTEAFSLDGLSQGECGAGIIDMIESDLASAQQSLLKAQEKDFALPEIKEALIYSARALLVVKGVDPKDEREAIDYFINMFVLTDICSPKFASLNTMYEDISSNIAPKATAFNYTQKLYEEVKTIYSQMDSSFNFPIRFTEGPEQQEQLPHQKEALVYDLRGTPCPINYVKTKLKLEELGVGDLLEVYLDEGEPVQSVPRSLQNDGQGIVATIKEQGFYRVTIKKKT